MKKIRGMRTLCLMLVVSMLAALCMSGCAGKQNGNIYAQAENWAFLETDTSEKTADVFFICPTVYGGDSDTFNMAMDDDKTKESFVGATNMEKAFTMVRADSLRPITGRLVLTFTRWKVRTGSRI